MAKRRMAVIAILICLCVWFSPCNVLAASTTDATQPIDINKECSLTFTCACDTTTVSGVTVRLYNVADVSNDFQFTLNQKFADTKLIINGIKTNSEWDVVRATLEAHIVANNIEPYATLTTNSNGQTFFENLKSGLYLAIADSMVCDDITYFFESALVSLPSLADGGTWQYDLSVSAKSEMIPPSKQEEEFKIVKFWKGDTGRNSRPDSIEVEIFKDGISYKKTILSQDNNWSYTFIDIKLSDKYNVKEIALKLGDEHSDEVDKLEDNKLDIKVNMKFIYLPLSVTAPSIVFDEDKSEVEKVLNSFK